MRIEQLQEQYASQAALLVQEEYDAERRRVSGLPAQDCAWLLTRRLTREFAKSRGLLALEGDKLLGFLCFPYTSEGQFGRVKGAFSPVHDNAFAGERRGEIASLLFQYAAQGMIRENILSYAICHYAHDEEILKSLILNGFGIRCADAVRRLDGPLSAPADTGCTFAELSCAQAERVLPLKHALCRHLRHSPIFLPCGLASMDEFMQTCRKRHSRFFVARQGQDVVGFLELCGDGETFVTEAPDMRSICGAFVLPVFRGTGVARALLSFLIETLRAEGVHYLGVDCETINPNALHFWGKYFDNYTYSLIRRIDERIVDIPAE